mgnify:CR=1 FL=1|jgi:hypothetical protein
MSTEPPPTPKPRRRWLQFSLRTLMIQAEDPSMNA